MTKRRRQRRERQPLHPHEVVELWLGVLVILGPVFWIAYQALKG